jgi:hypothetical protein
MLSFKEQKWSAIMETLTNAALFSWLVAASFRITYTDAAKYAANANCMDILDIRNLG